MANCHACISTACLRHHTSDTCCCRPVTFFKANESPWSRFSKVNYSEFTVNINPDELHLTQHILRGLLANPDMILRMQLALGNVQHKFVWDNESKAGVHWMVLSELMQHPARLH